MKITIEWSEEVMYKSVVDVDDDDLRAFLDEGAEPTLANVRDFLESGEEESWREQCDTSHDFAGVEDRSLERVTSLSGD